MSAHKTVRAMVFTDASRGFSDLEWLSYPDGSVKVHQLGSRHYHESALTHRELHSVSHFSFKELRDVPAV